MVDEARLQECKLEFGRLLEDNKYLSSEIARTTMNIKAMQSDANAYRRRLIARARIPSFNEIRLAAMKTF